MLIFDIPLIFFIIIILLFIVGVESITNWILDNLVLVAAILILKSAFLFCEALLDECKGIGYRAGVLVVILLDAARSGSVLWGIVIIVSDWLNSSLWGLIAGMFANPIVVCILLLAAEGPMYFAADIDDRDIEGILEIIMLEGLTIIAVNVINYMLLVEGI